MRRLILLILACLLVACGSHGSQIKTSVRVAPPLQSGGQAIQAAGEVSIDDALAEIDAYPCPDGVDAELWEELKGALGAALEDSCRAAIYGRRDPIRNDDGGDESPPYRAESLSRGGS